MDCEYKKKLKILYARAVVVVYLVSFVLVNVGFYSPVWYISNAENNETTICAEFGLVSGHCKYSYFNLDITHCQASVGSVLRTTFYNIVTGICILYLSFVFLVAGLALQCMEHPIFMSFFSIVVGVLYPTSAVLILFGTFHAERCFGRQVGYAAIITNIGGALMAVCYNMVRWYRKIFKFIERIHMQGLAHLR